MNSCPFLESAKSFLTTGKCSEGSCCSLGKVPPVGHLVVIGGIIVLLGGIFCLFLKKKREE